MADSRRSGRRSDYEWSHFGDVENTQDLATVAKFGSTGLLFQSTSTINRIRGRVGVVLDTGGIGEATMILCGMFVATSELVVAGSAPELGNNGVDEASWIWQGSLYLNSGAEAAVITEFLSMSIEVDTKAMRKVKANEELVFVHESPASLTTDQAGTYDLTYSMHVLSSR